MNRFAASVLLVAAMLAGCGANPPKPQKQQTAATPEQTPELFCQGVVANFNGTQTTDMDELVDGERFREIVSRIGDYNPNTIVGESIHDTLPKVLRMHFTKLIEATDMQWQLLRINDSGQTHQCLLRASGEDEGLQYIGAVVEQRPAGYRVVNYISYANEMYASDIIGRLYSDMSRYADAAFAAGAGSDASQRLNQLMQYLRLAKTAKAATLYQAFLDLPAELQTNHYLFNVRERAVLEADHTTEMAVLKRLKDNAGPGQLSLLMSDYYTYREQYGKAVNALEQLDERVGPDAVLEVTMADLLWQDDQTKAAYGHLYEAMDLDASYEDTYWTLLTIMVGEGDFNNAVRTLDVLKEGFGYQFTRSTYSGNQYFEPLIHSQAYLDWVGESY